MTPRSLVNGAPATTIAADDRGFRYGDGLFETVFVRAGAAPLWSHHMARLALGCERLGLPAPDPALLWREAREVAADLPSAAVRIAVSRGRGARGYAASAAEMPTRVVEAGPPPRLDPANYRDGVAVRVCATRLAIQPRLAGIKHANRLEQVLARAEWSDPATYEGVMCDPDGHAICATSANLFAVVDGVLVTPAVDRAGVAGVARAEVLARRPAARVRPLLLEELMDAGEVFLCSSLRGIVPVRVIAGARFAVGPQTRALLAAWRSERLFPEVGA